MSKHEGVLPSSSFETRARPFELCGSSTMRAPQDEDGRARAELRLVAEPFAVIPISRCQTAHRVPAAHFCVRGLQLRFTHPEIEGWAERRETFGCCAKHPLGVHVTRDARLSALHRGGFGPRGRASVSLGARRPTTAGICLRIRAASSSQPGRSTWRAGSRASRGKRLQAAAAGRHSSLRLQDVSGDDPQ